MLEADAIAGEIEMKMEMEDGGEERMQRMSTVSVNSVSHQGCHACLFNLPSSDRVGHENCTQDNQIVMASVQHGCSWYAECS